MKPGARAGGVRLVALQPFGNGVSGFGLSPPALPSSAFRGRSVKTTRPHWLASGTPTGVLNDMYWTELSLGTEIQSCVGGFTPSIECWASTAVNCPRGVTPRSTIQSASALPFGNVVLMNAVVGFG